MWYKNGIILDRPLNGLMADQIIPPSPPGFDHTTDKVVAAVLDCTVAFFK